MPLKYIFQRSLLRAEDYLRRNDYAAYRSKMLRFGSLFSRDNRKKIEASVAYLVNHYKSCNQKETILRTLTLLKRHGYNFASQTETKNTIQHSIMLKKCFGKNERGVILISFEKELLKLLNSNKFSEIEDKFQIIFLPSWQPVYSVPLLFLASMAKNDFFVMPSSFDELESCNNISSFCKPLPFHAASWVNEKFYPSTFVKKDIDIVIVAVFGKYKRHWKLFEALAELPNDLVVYLLGIPYESRSKESLLKEARAFGVENSIKIVESPSQDAIIDFMSRSKIFCALSHKEGSYIAVVESLMANTPVGMYANAIIGSKAYINEHTGVLFDPCKRLAPQLKDFIERSSRFSPGQWARANISARKNSIKLNNMLRQYSYSQEFGWNTDIEMFFCRHFDFHYYSGAECEEAFRDAYADFRTEFGLTLERPHPSE
jgi:glycosyltransferase involved in cell wall biosynthesis